MFDTRRVIMIGLLLAGCDAKPGSDDVLGESESGSETGDPSVDEAAVVASALDYTSFVRINQSAFASQHGLAKTVNVWVPAEHAVRYRELDPAASGPIEAFPAGALIVKEHLDAQASPIGLTIMFKAQPGFDPERADWWWGNAKLDGTLIDAGSVDYCIGCHGPRSENDWLFGIAADQQTPP